MNSLDRFTTGRRRRRRDGDCAHDAWGAFYCRHRSRHKIPNTRLRNRWNNFTSTLLGLYENMNNSFYVNNTTCVLIVFTRFVQTNNSHLIFCRCKCYYGFTSDIKFMKLFYNTLNKPEIILGPTTLYFGLTHGILFHLKVTCSLDCSICSTLSGSVTHHSIGETFGFERNKTSV